MLSLSLSPIQADEQLGGQENHQRTLEPEVIDDLLLVGSPELTITYILCFLPACAWRVICNS